MLFQKNSLIAASYNVNTVYSRLYESKKIEVISGFGTVTKIFQQLINNLRKQQKGVQT